MGKGGGKVLLLLGGQLQGGDVMLQFLRHPIELGGQNADFVIGADVGPDAVIAPRDLPGRAGQAADGGSQHGAEAEARHQAHRHGNEIHQLVGAQILAPQLIELGDIVAAFQIVFLLVNGEAAGDHHLIHRLRPVGHPEDLIVHIVLGLHGLHQPKPVVPEGGDSQGLLQCFRRDPGGGAGAALHCHGAENGAQ